MLMNLAIRQLVRLNTFQALMYSFIYKKYRSDHSHRTIFIALPRDSGLAFLVYQDLVKYSFSHSR